MSMTVIIYTFRGEEEIPFQQLFKIWLRKWDLSERLLTLSIKGQWLWLSW